MSKLKEINLKLTENEYRALIAMIDNSYNACQSGCAFGEMQKKNSDCSKCLYTIARHSVEGMFGI